MTGYSSGDGNEEPKTKFYRIAAVLLLLFAAGYTFGFRQNNPGWRADAVLGLMRSVHFDAQGFTRTYWDFFSAFGLFFLRVSCVRGGTSVAAGRTSGRDFGTRAQHCVGARHLFCGSHSFQLEIRLHHPHCFLNPYSYSSREIWESKFPQQCDLKGIEVRGPGFPLRIAATDHRLIPSSYGYTMD